jgi:hypothetical protein
VISYPSLDALDGTGESKVGSKVGSMIADEDLPCSWRVIPRGEITYDDTKKVLGRGSFGVVYRSALQGWKGRTVAVKELPAEHHAVANVLVRMDGGVGGGDGRGGVGETREIMEMIRHEVRGSERDVNGM